MLPRIEIWAMDLPERNQFTLSGGWKQDRARALFTALLPPGNAYYTAAEVVKTALPDKEHHRLYVAHYRALDGLARKHGISDGAFPGPDNVDETGKRLPGKKPGHLQPCRWHRDHWLGIISDEIYEWLRELNQTLVELAANSPPNARFWCDLDTFEIISDGPQAAGVQTAESTVQCPPAEARRRYSRGGHRIMKGLAVAAILILMVLSRKGPPVFVPAPIFQAQEDLANPALFSQVEEDDYLKQNTPQLRFSCSPPLLVDYALIAKIWKTGRWEPEAVSQNYPPRIFISANYYEQPALY